MGHLHNCLYSTMAMKKNEKNEKKKKKKRQQKHTIQTHKRFRKMLIYYDIDKTNFRGNPICQATKQHLNNSQMVKNAEK